MSVTPEQIPVSTSVPALTLAAGSTGGVAAASSIDPVNDYIGIYTASATATQGINRNTFLGLSSSPVGISDGQTLTNKALTAPTVSNPVLSGTLTGTYTIAGTPTFPASVVLTGATQTLTGKTLTSPTLNSPNITNATYTGDAIIGYTTANSGTIYGVSVTNGAISGSVLSAGTVGTTALATNAVQASQLAMNAITLGYAQITSTFSTASTSTVQITGLTLTITVPSGGRRVKITAFSPNSTLSTAGNLAISIWQGTVGTGTQLSGASNTLANTSYQASQTAIAIISPSAGSVTYNIGMFVSAGTGTIESSSAQPAFILVEAI